MIWIFLASVWFWEAWGEERVGVFQEFKENVVFFQCLSQLFVGTRGDFKFGLGASFVQN